MNTVDKLLAATAEIWKKPVAMYNGKYEKREENTSVSITTVLFDPDGSKTNEEAVGNYAVSVYPHGNFDVLKSFLNTL